MFVKVMRTHKLPDAFSIFTIKVFSTDSFPLFSLCFPSRISIIIYQENWRAIMWYRRQKRIFPLIHLISIPKAERKPQKENLEFVKDKGWPYFILVNWWDISKIMCLGWDLKLIFPKEKLYFHPYGKTWNYHFSSKKDDNSFHMPSSTSK